MKTVLSLNPVTILVLLRVMNQHQDYLAMRRQDIYLSDGELVSFADNKENYTSIIPAELDQLFEYADWAYYAQDGQIVTTDNNNSNNNNNDATTKTLDQALSEQGYTTLVRSDNPGLPGYVSHYVALNVKERTVLISIKGTDACAAPIPVTLGEEKDAMHCHEGIWLSSQRLYRDLYELMQEWILPTQYKVILTGHSLGAGVASLVGLLLKQKWPSLPLHVYAFAPPPMVDRYGSLSCQDYVTTVVNQWDIIPRASLSNVQALLAYLQSLQEQMERDSGETLPTDLLNASKYVVQLLAQQTRKKKKNDNNPSASSGKASSSFLLDVEEINCPSNGTIVPNGSIRWFES
eukprot:CAMPEP_0178901346 /NCGR_PEP_ID=MMETSP0786-20121207/3969_1 /TAXON_ID=186022 /ORGANISM="Thalassionema frauenfeldii, Strain CCMP 1798" /LENGTH=347 /DNA_ID=CAMNT_0020572433 /DNA_START=468 /DNA_END=1511 /DNA_ORIENTATION=-